MRVLVVEPYFAGSHRAWAEGLARHSAHDVTLVYHEGRFWKWRMHGAHVTLADAARRALAGATPDVVVGSSMLNLTAFLGAARTVVGGAPAALYMHENQLTYPPVPGEARDLAYPMIQWTGMIAADRVLFNSEFHRTAWFEALPDLLKHFPDHTHVGLVDAAAARSEVLPVGVDLRRLDGPAPERSDPPLVLWNHRWEHDKNPGEFFAALDRLIADGVEFTVALAGENFSNVPAEFAAARARLGSRVVHYGYAEPDRYVDLVRRAAVVVSTAHQEFFGVAVVEAIYAGATPVLPNRLAYPELLPESAHDRCLYEDFEGLVGRLRTALVDQPAPPPELRAAMARFDWSVLSPRYDALLTGLAGS